MLLQISKKGRAGHDRGPAADGTGPTRRTSRILTEIIADNLQLGPRPAGAGDSPVSRGEPMADIKNPPVSSGRSDKVADSDIPIIDENEPMHAGVEEDEMKIKEEDLPF